MAVREQNRKKKILIGDDTNALTWLIILNSLFFAGILSVKVIFYLTAGIENTNTAGIDSWVALPVDGYQLLTRPWTLITYMFAHNSIWYLISSLLWLWCFGYILQDLAGNNKLFPIYLYGGFFGGLSFIITANLIPSIHANAAAIYIMGAGTPVMAIAVATTALSPKFRILPMLNGGIPLWVLTLVFAAIDLGTIGLSHSGTVAISHIVAGATGFFFIYQLKHGRDIGKWITDLANWVNDLFNPEKKYTETTHQQLYYKATRIPFEKTHHFSQQKLDEILDKINEQGYHLLTEEEKEFLKKASKENF
ncbi:rhomboid family intramembrane serine protease [Parafilimonas sp.]|uniref:rhomboid family intramembrane serine protease n=1 Tax=Parafilimonas sp. TaxID=1969739 RepID=UPI003F7DDAA4